MSPSSHSRALGLGRSTNAHGLADGLTRYNSGFTYSLAYLQPPASANPTSTAAGLIDSVLASGTKSGYSFTYSPGASDSTGRINTYDINAQPIISSTGTNYYFTDQSGVIRQNSTTTAAASDSPIAG